MNLMWLITRGDSIGGAQVHVRDLATRAHSDGHDVLVVTGVPGPLTKQLTAAGVPIRICDGMQREVSPHRDWAAIRSVGSILSDVQPDLLTCHSSKAGVIGRLAAKKTGIPAVFTAHGWAFTGGVPQPRRMVYRAIERVSAPLAARIICVSDYDRRLGIEIGIDPGKLRTIHNGMPDVDISLRAKPATGEQIRAVMIARFDRQKDHDTLLRAMLDVPELSIDLVGDGPNRATIEELVATLGLGERVRLWGQREDVAQILSNSHIFVLSSHWEGLPLSTLEAMRAGLPVIVSDVGGAGEAVDEGETGFVVPPGDRDALVVRLKELVASAERRAQMGSAGRGKFEREFTFEQMYQQTISLYEATAAQPGRENSPDRA